MNLVYKAARDFITADVDRVLIDDEEEYRKVRDFLQLLGPQYIDRIEYYNSGRSLFDDYKIDDELQKLMKPKINLPSGGSIVIESTEALTVIDVNSGKFTGGTESRRYDRQDQHRSGGGDRAPSAFARHRRHHRRGLHRHVVGGVAQQGHQDDRGRPAPRPHARDDPVVLESRACSNSRANASGRISAAQLRGACPTCIGMGSVMSSQSVAIETFRRIRDEARNGAPGDVVVHVAPTVAVQMEFWYEEECEELAQAIGSPIHVRVDPMIHPEKARVEMASALRRDKERALRVGDEHEIELLPGRLPNPTSAAAVVDGRVTEVENAANNAGSFARIRILDVDDEDDYVLAEMVTAGAKPRRKRRRTPSGVVGRRADATIARACRGRRATIGRAPADRHHVAHRRGRG